MKLLCACVHPKGTSMSARAYSCAAQSAPCVRPAHRSTSGRQDCSYPACDPPFQDREAASQPASMPHQPQEQAQLQWQQQAAAAARVKLQQLVEAEMAREAERGALLSRAQDTGDRRRLQQVFEVERRRAMALVQQLQRQMQG